MRQSPCYGCERRSAECHGSCSDYGQWRVEHERENEQRRIQRERRQKTRAREFKTPFSTKEIGYWQ